jgi:hypothetical protein
MCLLACVAIALTQQPVRRTAVVHGLQSLDTAARHQALLLLRIQKASSAQLALARGVSTGDSKLAVTKCGVSFFAIFSQLQH